MIETRTKKQRRYQHVVYKTFREDMSYPASAGNIPNNKRRAKASWQDDDIDMTYHINMPNQLRQVMSPNPHSLDVQRHVSETADHHSCVNRRQANDWAQTSPNPHLDIQGHVSERSDRHSFDSKRVTDRTANRWRRSTASQICRGSPASLGVSRTTKRRIETKNIRDGSFEFILNSWHRNDNHPVGSLSENEHQTNGNLTTMMGSVNQLHDLKSEE